jgi:hypothetical protein
MRKAVCFAGLAAASLLPLVGPAQDNRRDWLDEIKEFCASGDLSRADSIRRDLAESKDAAIRGPVRAIRSVLLTIATADRKEASAQIAALAAYLDKAGDLRDPATGLTAAGTVKTDASLWLSLGHLDQLLAAGGDGSAHAARLKIDSLSGGRFATPDGRLLEQIRKISDGGEIEKIAARAKGNDLKYYAGVAYLKQLEKDYGNVDKASRVFASIRKGSEAHVDAILSVLKTFKSCASCKGSKKIACFACKGAGKREVVCPQCHGNGTIAWDSRIEKSDKRKQIDQMLGLPQDKSYCPTCITRKEVTRRTDPCAFCEQKGFVECQRCKWQKATLESVGKLQPCENCESTGFLFSKVLHPCSFCKGLGEFLIPNADSSVTVGPVR